MRQIRQINGKFTKERLESILGEPTWEWEETEDDAPACGLAQGILLTAGWGNSRACCRVWIHENGICVAPGLKVAEDIQYAENAYQKLLKGTQ